MESKPLGYHGIWDVHGCEESLLNFRENIEVLMDLIVSELGLTKLNASFKQFEPVGVTGVYLLSESHLSIHTWPERNYAAVDIFSCSPFKEGRVEAILKEHLKASHVEIHFIERGVSEVLAK